MNYKIQKDGSKKYKLADLESQLRDILEPLPVPSSVWFDVKFNSVYSVVSRLHTDEVYYISNRSKGGTKVYKVSKRIVYKIDDPVVLCYSSKWNPARKALAEMPLGASLEIRKDEMKKYRNISNQLRMYNGKKFMFRRQESGNYKIYYVLESDNLKGARTTITQKVVKLEVGEWCYPGEGKYDRKIHVHSMVSYWSKKLNRKFKIEREDHKLKITRIS